MKRLLRKKKQHFDEHRIPEHARTLRVDTAFKDKSFGDIERLEIGDGLFNAVAIDDFKSWRIEGSEEWGTKDDVRINPLQHANMEEVSEIAETKKEWEKNMVAFKDAPLIDTRNEELQMMVGEYEQIAAKSDYQYEMAKHAARMDTNHPRTKAFCLSQDTSEDIFEGSYGSKTKARLVESFSTPDWSFGAPVRSKSNGEGKKDKGQRRISGQMPNQPYIQKIGGQIHKSISLPNVICSSSFLTYSSYDGVFDETSLSDGDTNDSILGDLVTTAAADNVTEELQRRELCSGSNSSNDEIPNFQDSKKVKIEIAHKSLPEKHQDFEGSRIEEATIASKLAEELKPNEDEQQHQVEASEDEELENSLIENATGHAEGQENQADKAINIDTEVEKYKREETNNECTSTDVDEKVQQHHGRVKVSIDVELDKNIGEEIDIECKLIEDSATSIFREDAIGQEEGQKCQEDFSDNEEAELDNDSHEEAIIECKLIEDVTAQEEGQQYEEDARVTTIEEMKKNSLDPSKQILSEKQCDLCGKESTDVEWASCLTQKEKTIQKDEDTDETEHAGSELIQINEADPEAAEEVKVQVGVEGDKVVCDSISNYRKPPASMERILCTCPKRSENNYEISQKLSSITDTAQQAMENNNSMEQKLEESPPNGTCELKHTVQLHQKEKHNDCTGQGNCGAEKMNFDIGSNSSSEENDTWSLIPSTVQYSETQGTRHGSLDFSARCISSTSQTTEVETRYTRIEIQSLTSKTESATKQNVNMQDIELRLGAKGVSFHRMDKAYDMELGIGCEERPASRHASALDKISGILRGLKNKRKSSGYKARAKDPANTQHELVDSGIELVDMKSKKNMGSGKTTNNVEEKFTGSEKEETALDNTFILEGANEAKEELKTIEERVKEKMLAEKSRLVDLIDNTTLSHKQRCILILVLCAIDADMPEDFFGCLRKSRMFNALLNAQIGLNRELILDNMVSTDYESS